MVKLLVIGWDGASHDHLQEIEPEFYSSLEHGGKLLPEPLYQGIPIDSGTAWTTITTGLEVEEHGFLSINNVVRSRTFLKYTKQIARLIPAGKMRTYLYYGPNKLLNLRERTPRSHDVPYRRLWDYIDGRTLTLGVPLTYPAWKHDGVMLSGIPAPLAASQPTSYPQDYEKHRQRYDAYYYLDGKTPLEEEDQPNLETYKDRIVELNEEAFNVVEELAEEEDFQLIFAVVPLIDDLLHALDPDQDWDEIEEAYETLDSWTADLVDAIDPDHVLILSDHGMMPVEDSLNPNTYPGLRMDHDSMNGIWASDHDFDLEQQKDITPAVLELFGQGFEQERMELEIEAATDEAEDIEV